MRILETKNRKDKRFLKKKTKEFDFDRSNKAETQNLVREMRDIMRKANGIGLSANQVGLNKMMFVANFDGKFYSVFNPEITTKSKSTISIEEGCLSIPGEFVEVPRSEKITLRGFDKNGRKIKIKASGILAIIFQHEVDHLNGRLITDYKK